MDCAPLEPRGVDRLTGLPNRAGFWDRVQPRPDGWSLTWRMGLALIDLDDIEKVNEEYGRAAGDGTVAGWASRPR